MDVAYDVLFGQG